MPVRSHYCITEVTQTASESYDVRPARPGLGRNQTKSEERTQPGFERKLFEISSATRYKLSQTWQGSVSKELTTARAVQPQAARHAHAGTSPPAGPGTGWHGAPHAHTVKAFPQRVRFRGLRDTDPNTGSSKAGIAQTAGLLRVMGTPLPSCFVLHDRTLSACPSSTAGRPPTARPAPSAGLKE